MPLFRRAPAEHRSLGELVDEAKGFVEEHRAELEPDEDLVPTMIMDGRKGVEIHALAVPGDALQRQLKRLSRKADRFVFCAMAWQAEGVTDPSIRAEDHPDRFEVVLVQAADMESGREELWRARVERVQNAAPRLGAWERTT